MILALHPRPGFPFYLHLGSHVIHPHIFFETLAYIISFGVYLSLRHRFRDPVATPLRWAMIAVAVSGAAIGSKFLFWLEDPQLTWHNLHNPAYLLGGKTIVGALAFGLLTVELTKRYIGLRQPTGDLYALPLAVGIAIGRIGCFLTGLSDNTYGTPSNLPWAVNFGDGIPRHPTQLYEIVFLLLLIPILYRVLKRTSTENEQTRIVILSEAVTKRSEVTAKSKDPAFAGTIIETPRHHHLLFPGDAFKLFMVAYVSVRLLSDFLKPYPRILLGLGGIQWACILILLYYSRDVSRWLHFSQSQPV